MPSQRGAQWLRRIGFWRLFFDQMIWVEGIIRTGWDDRFDAS